jgi:hypothetical protein
MPAEGRIPARCAATPRVPATARRPGRAPRGVVAAAAGPRPLWLVGALLLTLGGLVGAVLLAPGGDTAPGRALGGLLLLGSSVRIATTAWLATAPEARRQAAGHRGRRVAAPPALVAGAALLGAVLPAGPFTLLLLGCFGWQVLHFQRQNLGLAALARAGCGGAPLSRGERLAITAAGAAGTAGLLGHPELLRLVDAPRPGPLFPVAAGAYALAVGYGVVQLTRRAPGEQRDRAGAAYLASLLFFLPVFLFRSPGPAMAGLAVAHGGQYLLVAGPVAGGGSGPRAQRLVRPAAALTLGLVLGLALDLAWQPHPGGRLDRAVLGACLGLVTAHLVADAGLRRPRGAFPRSLPG